MTTCEECGHEVAGHDCGGCLRLACSCTWVYYADEGGARCLCHPWLLMPDSSGAARICQTCGGDYFTWPGAYTNPTHCEDCEGDT